MHTCSNQSAGLLPHRPPALQHPQPADVAADRRGRLSLRGLLSLSSNKDGACVSNPESENPRWIFRIPDLTYRIPPISQFLALPATKDSLSWHPFHSTFPRRV